MEKDKRLPRTLSFGRASKALNKLQRRIKAVVTIIFHGVQNVNVADCKNSNMASMHWRCGGKKINKGSTPMKEIIQGMVTWKHKAELEVTFVQNVNTKEVEERLLTLSLKTDEKGSKGHQKLEHTKSIKLNHYYHDKKSINRIIALSDGYPITLKLTIKTRWTHIDDKEIAQDDTHTDTEESYTFNVEEAIEDIIPKESKIEKELQEKLNEALNESKSLKNHLLGVRKERDLARGTIESLREQDIKEIKSLQERIQKLETEKQELKNKTKELFNYHNKVVQLEERLEIEQSTHKLLIQFIFLSNNPNRSAGAIIEILENLDWDERALMKITTSYALFLDRGHRSYEHCISILSQICALCEVLSNGQSDGRSKLSINNPNSGIKPSEGNRTDFANKMEMVTERAFIDASVSVFSHISTYLAPSILNHMPADHVHRLEQTVTEGGFERGKFMIHTIINVFNNLLVWCEISDLPEKIILQLYVTICRNINSYLFQYLIQTPSICTSSNSFIIRTRISLLHDWFTEHEGLKRAYKEFLPINEAAMLLSLNCESLESMEMLKSICPTLNNLQILSLAEMVQKNSKESEGSEGLNSILLLDIDDSVKEDDDTSLFFRPCNIVYDL